MSRNVIRRYLIEPRSIRSGNGRVAQVALCRAVGVVSFPIADPRNSRLVTIESAHVDTETSLASLTF